MTVLGVISRKLRRQMYRVRFERGFAVALQDYESVFQEILDDLYRTPETPRRLMIDFGWTATWIPSTRAPIEEYESLPHPHPAVRLLASQLHFAYFLADDKDFADRYRAGWRESLRVIRHNEDQQETFSLLVNERAALV